MKLKTSLTVAVAALATGLSVMPAGSWDNSDFPSLREPIPLSLRYDVGETLCYRLVRHTTMFAIDGTKSGEHRAVAYFTRTRVDDDRRGRAREKFAWKSFAFGQSMDPAVPARLSCLREAQDFSVVCSVQDEDMLTKLDFSALPRNIEGFMFMVMAWDAVTFDGPVRSQEHFPFPDEAIVGAEIEGTRGPHDFEFEYPPLVTDSRYAFSGKNSSKVLGVGTVRDIPCAVVEFSYAENGIEMNFDLPPVKLKIRGFEHIWGKTYLSLEDGRIVKGELVAPVVQVQDMRLPGQSEPKRTELLSLQRLNMEILDPDDFELEVIATRSEGDH